MSVVAVRSPSEFRVRLGALMRSMHALTASHPGFPDWEAIAMQLEDLDRWTQGGRPPTASQCESLTFGFLAYRSVASFDDELCDELIAVSDYVKRRWR